MTLQPKWDEEKFTAVTGYAPTDDDLDRVNCEKAGQAGHFRCGVCTLCGHPRFMCRCGLKRVQSLNNS